MFDKKQIIEIDNYICLVKKISSKKFYEKKYNKVCKKLSKYNFELIYNSRRSGAKKKIYL